MGGELKEVGERNLKVSNVANTKLGCVLCTH